MTEPIMTLPILRIYHAPGDWASPRNGSQQPSQAETTWVHCAEEAGPEWGAQVHQVPTPVLRKGTGLRSI